MSKDKRQDAHTKTEAQAAQRLRITFSQQGALRYVGHLDMVRTWERILRRAGVPLAYSEGFNPQPRMFFAAALPLGATGQRELADVMLSQVMTPEAFVAQISPHLPAGLRVIDAVTAPLKTPALQSVLRASEWQVDVQIDAKPQHLVDAIDDFLAQETAPSSRKRKGRAVSYDLRPLVLALDYAGQPEPGWHRLSMVVRSEPNATGRPDAVLAALNLADHPARIDRQRCMFDDQVGPVLDRQ